ncbi:hypothetical protein NL50_13310 [Clostridium acetobutylicum]|nr:hypothetical protein NL50_13310 [Clostridium acetobutylicum]
MENEVVLVEIFGVKEKASCSGCSSKTENSSCSSCSGCSSQGSCEGGCSSGGCGNSESMYNQYEAFKEYIAKTDVAANVEVQFIDVSEIDINKYKYVEGAIGKKYMLPVVAINEFIRFHGGMKDRLIYNAIKKELNNIYM